ncbi:hypothetical protein Vretimale_11166 [Volvox reticuliferus]|uniref:tRNA/rRNA methyltransferase SpoU type domain-containing protein n=1 Tax=Volvox reticuliferus TaxID=1737510 RepID=A0A8J4CHZ8_9CHLO|nr:hypothetical protein Vretifemale_12052 [Volvox reticuliferus]GIM06926.1 hypothetical protein Vretimale_11166 [Volvox reticuliferus]
MQLPIIKEPMRVGLHNSRMSGAPSPPTLGRRAIRGTPSTRHVSTIDWAYLSSLVCKSDSRERTKWYGVYTEEQYLAQRQSEERARWAAGVRTLTNNQAQISWDDSLLDPPALLGGVTVVIISPRKPVSVGTVARACGSFECEDLRIVMPRQESYITRHAKSASKGAQYILYRAGHYDSIAEATADCDVRIAFTRWTQASSAHVYKVDINGLISHPAVRRVITQPLQLPGGVAPSKAPRPPPSAPWTEAASAAAAAAEARLMTAEAGSAAEPPSSSEASLDEGDHVGPKRLRYGSEQEQQQLQCCHIKGAVDGLDGNGNNNGGSGQTSPASGPDVSSNDVSSSSSSSAGSEVYRPPRVALVFGREELGMSDEEVDSCEVCCAIPIGRLQESLSLSHAVSIALCSFYQARLQHLSSSSSSSTEVAAAVASPLPAVAAVAIGAEGDVARCVTPAQSTAPASESPAWSGGRRWGPWQPPR